MGKALEQERVDLKFRAEVLMMMGWIQNNPAKGIQYIEQSVKTDSGYSLGWHNLGVLYERTGQEQKALDSYLKSTEKDAQNFWAMASISKLYMLSKNPEIKNKNSALKWAQRADSLSYHQEPSILKTLARAYSENSNFKKSLEVARAAISIAEARQLDGEVLELERDVSEFKNRKKFSSFMKKSD